MATPQSQPPAQSLSPTRPNIILITTDQQRGDCIGIDENSPDCLQTPNIDSLAGSGARFRRGYTECPSCIPARRSLMTGMAPAAQGMVGMVHHDFDPAHTLAGELGKAGYHTFLSGKLHLQPKGKRFGFDHQFLADAAYFEGPYLRWLRETHGNIDPDAGSTHGVDSNGWVGVPTHLPIEQTLTYFCVSKAIEFLKYDRDPTAPFFLNLSLVDPHPPLVPPQVYYDRYINRPMPAPAIGDWAKAPPLSRKTGIKVDSAQVNLSKYDMDCCRAAYYATINFVDDQIGRLILHLKRNNLIANTWILFTSDHGEMLGDHYRFRKTQAYEGSSRVPYIITPAKTAGLAPSVHDCPVGLQDVMPTLLDIAGVPVPQACTGKSLLPILRGEKPAVRDVIHGEHAAGGTSRNGVHYLVSDRYKYIWYGNQEVEHLFDLQNDPLEKIDLALKPDGQELLSPWRERMVEFLKDRPEGFVKEGKLVRGAAHKYIVPGHEIGKFNTYL